MTPNVRSSKELTWSWAYSTGHPASDQKLEAAAHAAWSYASLCAWTYLNDHDSAVDLMDHAVQNASQYLARHIDAPEQKLTARIKSVIRRRARQLCATICLKRSRSRGGSSRAANSSTSSASPGIGSATTMCVRWICRSDGCTPSSFHERGECRIAHVVRNSVHGVHPGFTFVFDGGYDLSPLGLLES